MRAVHSCKSWFLVRFGISVRSGKYSHRFLAYFMHHFKVEECEKRRFMTLFITNLYFIYRRGTIGDFAIILSCFQMPWLSWQSKFRSTLKYCLSTSSSVCLFFLFLSLCLNCRIIFAKPETLTRGQTILVSVS